MHTRLALLSCGFRESTFSSPLSRVHFGVAFPQVSAAEESRRGRVEAPLRVGRATGAPVVAAGAKKARIGFLSKFFGEHEPHGLLLEGVVQHLPRRFFTVVVLPIASPGHAVGNVQQYVRSSPFFGYTRISTVRFPVSNLGTIERVPICHETAQRSFELSIVQSPDTSLTRILRGSLKRRPAASALLVASCDELVPQRANVQPQY